MGLRSWLCGWFCAQPEPEKPFYKKLVLPTRFVMAMMMFFACWINYMMRVNISVNIIAMCPVFPEEPENPEDTGLRLGNVTRNKRAQQPHSDDKTDYPVTFTWTEQEQAYVLSGYFWGYSATCFFAGIAAEFWGPKRLVFLTTMLAAVLTLVSPLAAKLHYGMLVAVRILCGCGGGFLYPCLHNLVAHWSPPAEKGKFVSALLGGAIGTVATWSVTGVLIQDYGWDYAFYVPGAIAAIYSIIWMMVVYDSPVQHPRISAEEKKYILTAIGTRVHQSTEQTTQVLPPFRHIFTSLPFLAMVILQFGSLWGLFFVMTAAPKYVSSVLGFDLAKAGGVASLPYLGRMIFAVIFGSIGDRIVEKKLLSITVMRKVFCIFSHILPGTFLIVLGYNETGSPTLCVALITISMAFNGAATLTNLANHQDLAPNFAGTLYGIATAIGTSAGFITPIVTAHFVQHGHTQENWRPVFLVGACIYMGCAVYFIIFGTGKTQKWNNMIDVVKKPSTGKA